MDEREAARPGIIRIVIAEDHGLVAEGLSTMLSLEGDMEIVDMVASGEALVESVEHHRPDVALVDVKLVGMDGLTAVQHIHQRGGPTRMMALTMSTDQATVSRAVAAGVVGYLPKNVRREELVQAVRAVAGGKGFLHPDVTRPFLDRAGPTGDPGLTPLSKREQEVLEQLAAGRSTREIAEVLGLGDETVKSHLSRIYAKLKANDRVQAVVTAMRHGLVR
ncbi:MAG: response regulator transcription factor [Egibacteraceae bacterium]